MKNKIISFLLCTILSVTYISCGNKAVKEEEKEHAEEHEHHSEGSEVTITQKQFDAIKIQLGAIEQKNLTNTLKVTGFLKVPPQNKAAITSIMGGTVQNILIQEGDYVSKGQAVATLIHPDFVKLQQDYLDTQAQLTYAEAEYNRQKELSDKNVSAKKTFQQAQSNFNSLKSKFHALKQQLSLIGIDASSLNSENISSEISIKSPINGNISHVDINIGSTVEGSKELMDVVDNTQLHLDLFVYEQDLTKIKVGQPVDVTLTNLPGRQYTAKIFAIGSAFEGESKSIPVHATITGDKTGLIEGMNVVAKVNIASNLTTAVLSSAIVNSEGRDFIFVRHDENKDSSVIAFQKIEIKKGITNNVYTEITTLSEVKENPQVVTNGSFYLLSMLTNAGEEGHEH
jgi:RND family efflux transporter MFP subunit